MGITTTPQKGWGGGIFEKVKRMKRVGRKKVDDELNEGA